MANAATVIDPHSAPIVFCDDFAVYCTTLDHPDHTRDQAHDALTRALQLYDPLYHVSEDAYDAFCTLSYSTFSARTSPEFLTSELLVFEQLLATESVAEHPLCQAFLDGLTWTNFVESAHKKLAQRRVYSNETIAHGFLRLSLQTFRRYQ